MAPFVGDVDDNLCINYAWQFGIFAIQTEWVAAGRRNYAGVFAFATRAGK